MVTDDPINPDYTNAGWWGGSLGVVRSDGSGIDGDSVIVDPLWKLNPLVENPTRRQELWWFRCGSIHRVDIEQLTDEQLRLLTAWRLTNG